MAPPGIVLSQPTSTTSASNMCPRATSSIESAITSRETSEVFMPSVPMVMPSLIAMVLNSMGVPPASRTPRFTCSASRRRLKLHGMVSVQVLAMPTIGRARSASEKPIALKYERAGARSRPSRRVWLLWRGSSDMDADRSAAWSRGEARGTACPPRPPVLRGLRGGEPGRNAPDRARAARAAPGRGEGRASERVRADPISRAARARGVAAAAGEAAAHDRMAAAPPGATRVERVPASDISGGAHGGPASLPLPVKVRAAICWEPQRPLVIDEIDLEGPRAGECLVRLVATGACHTDAYTMSGRDPSGLFPAVLGHEGGGVVEEVGPGLTSLRPGDHVIPLYIPECRQCEFCLSGRTNLCGALLATQDGGPHARRRGEGARLRAAPAELRIGRAPGAQPARQGPGAHRRRCHALRVERHRRVPRGATSEAAAHAVRSRGAGAAMEEIACVQHVAEAFRGLARHWPLPTTRRAGRMAR